MNMQGSRHNDATETLIADFRASRVSFSMWGTKKAIGDADKAIAASAFGANADFLGATKKLINTRADAFRAVTSLKSQMNREWESITLPYPEPGIRLIREDRVLSFNDRMVDYRSKLLQAVDNLDDVYYSLRVEASRSLGSLYNESDYPITLRGLFDVSWEFPNVTPPEYLRQLNPDLYEQERLRIVSRFDEAVDMAEQAFVREFQKLVSHLAERLTGVNADGRPKRFEDSTVGNLLDFFDRFRQLSVRSNADLDSLVDRARDMIQHVNPSDIKPENGTTTALQDMMRNTIATNMNDIAEQLDGMMRDVPRRRVVMPKGEPAAV